MNELKKTLFGDLLRGHTDTIILAILARGDSYGYRINQLLDDETNHLFSLNEATLYTTFKRLESQGYIRSYYQTNQNQQQRKFYALTNEGREFLKESQAAWKDAQTIINHFILESK